MDFNHHFYFDRNGKTIRFAGADDAGHDMVNLAAVALHVSDIPVDNDCRNIDFAVSTFVKRWRELGHNDHDAAIALNLGLAMFSAVEKWKCNHD